MSAAEDKKFVMKHVFTDVMNMKKGEMYYGKEENHFNVPWALTTFKDDDDDLNFHLKCEKLSKNCWSIKTKIELKLFDKNGTVESSVEYHTFQPGEKCTVLLEYDDSNYVKNNYLIDGSLKVECLVKITEMTGINEKLRNFDDTLAKEFSDVVLVVENQKFYYLASQSDYFKSLLFGNFQESKQSEITLKDVDPYEFQNFLEALHGEPTVNDDTVFGILQLADMYDSKTAIRRCEEFLIVYSKKSLKDKFDAAIKFKMDSLKKKCMAEIKTKQVFLSVLPEDLNEMGPSDLKELLRKSISLM